MAQYNKDYSKNNSEIKSQIKKCYDYFVAQINEDKETFTEDNIKKFFDNLDKIVFCVILLNGYNQQQIFDTLNSNAVALSQAELIKNNLFNKDNIKLYETNWRDIFETEDNREYWNKKIGSRINLDTFLLSLYYVNCPQHIKDADLAHKYKENNIDWIRQIKAKYLNYQNNLSFDDTIDSNVARLNLVMNYLGIYTPIPYIFYLSVNSPNEIEPICKYLEIYLIRRYIADYDTRGYNKFFISLIEYEINTLEALKNEIGEYDEEDRKQLGMPAFVEETFCNFEFKNTSARLILYLIESHLRGGYSKINEFSYFSVEHLNPVKKKEYEHTVRMQNKIHTIGNLTIITKEHNSILSNKDWKEKQTIFSDKEKGFYAIQNLSDWIECNMSVSTNIYKRAVALHETAQEIWGDKMINNL